MDETEKAAIILFGMGEEKAAEVLKHMEPKQVEKIVGTMTNLQHISQEQINEALNNFMSATEKTTSLGFHSDDYIRNTLVHALGEEKAMGIIDKTLVETEFPQIENLKWQDEHTIYTLIRDEHPQVIAVILTFLDSEKSAKLLKLVSDVERNDIIRRIATMDTLSPQAITELNKALEEESINLRSFSANPLAGAKSVANIINYLDKEMEDNIMESVAGFDEKIKEEIEEHIFPFERLADLDKRSLQKLLRDIPNDVMVVALKGVESSIAQCFFNNMSERAALMLKDDMEAKGPVQLSKVLTGQKEIVTIAQRMAKDGQIVLGGKSDDMVG